jgi:hypothetical protein
MPIKVSRDWATPLTVGAFMLLASTGALMFFHLDSGMNKLAHEWLSWLLLAGVALHATSNWAGLKKHLGAGGRGRWFLAAFVVLFGLSFLRPPGAEAKKPSPARLALKAMLAAPLRDLAPLSGRPAEQLLQDLRAADLKIDSDSQPLAAVTRGDRGAEGRALEVVFGKR